jgi:hypothetical protein
MKQTAKIKQIQIRVFFLFEFVFSLSTMNKVTIYLTE